jgi:hypothetical protein
MSSKPRADNKITVKVNRATGTVRRAIGRLVRLLGEEDDDEARAAAVALLGLGGRAIAGPLAAALPRATSPRHRGLIVELLASSGPEEGPTAIRSLLAARKQEHDLQVAALIQVKLMALLLPGPGKPGPDPPESAEDGAFR